MSADGTVTSFGQAANFGGTENLKLTAPIVGMAPTPNGLGYWLAAADGGVFTFGQARFYGSLGGRPYVARRAIIAIVPTADGKGYWLANARGRITAFGDAPRLPSLKANAQRRPIVGFAVAPNQHGAWMVSDAGVTFRIGDVTNYGSLKGQKVSSPIVAMARSQSGEGYWLTAASGDVWAFGNATPVAPASQLAGSVVSISAAPGTSGYWAAATDGEVFAAGVPSQGQLENESGPDAIAAIATTAPVPTPLSYPVGSVGYDINWPQCASGSSAAAGVLPGPPDYNDGSMSYSVAVVGVDGWAIDDDNPCLGAEASWAAAAQPAPGIGKVVPYQLYLFLNSPASTSTIDQTGPAGTCAGFTTGQAACLAYNYGYNAALDAVIYAKSQGASASKWWLDIENDVCAPGQWNDAANGEWWSCRTTLNDRTIQGALDALRYDQVTPGVYSTSIQWDAITGSYVPKGGQLPLWIAGATWTSPPYPSNYGYGGTSQLASYCSGSYDFGGGQATLLQETPGSNNYPFDPDYAC